MKKIIIVKLIVVLFVLLLEVVALSIPEWKVYKIGNFTLLTLGIFKICLPSFDECLKHDKENFDSYLTMSIICGSVAIFHLLLTTMRLFIIVAILIKMLMGKTLYLVIFNIIIYTSILEGLIGAGVILLVTFEYPQKEMFTHINYGELNINTKIGYAQVIYITVILFDVVMAVSIEFYKVRFIRSYEDLRSNNDAVAEF